MNTRYLQTVSQLQLILLSILLQAKNCKNNNLLIKLSEHKHFDKKSLNTQFYQEECSNPPDGFHRYSLALLMHNNKINPVTF
jgi:hypothetical protein